MKALVALAAGVIGGCCYGAHQGSGSATSVAHAAAATTAKKPTALAPSEFRSFPLVSSYDESHDTKVLRFALPEADVQAGLECASCVLLKYTDADGKAVVRPYTPISKIDQIGYFEIMVKQYKGSKMGSHLHALKKGETIEVKGPITKIPVKANQWAHIGMIAGGTGIAPMYQVAREVLRTPKNNTQISLIYASRRKEDVLLGNEINELMGLYPKFSPYFVLSAAPTTWMGGIGHVNKEMIKSFMPPPNRAHDTIIMVCGPPGFMQTVCGDKDFTASPPTQGELKGLLKEMGYVQKQVFKF